MKGKIKKISPIWLWEFLKRCRSILYGDKRHARRLINADLTEYTRQIFLLPDKKSNDFVEPRQIPAAARPGCPKPIAFYLPQFAPFAENDAWWGKGFTEWTNVTKAVPQFVGHHQPRLPADLGFYDLRVPEVMTQQVEIAKHYGIHGFCFHYYWFSGKRLMEKPLFRLLDDKELEMPFCLCWANEPWSRRWDGSENELLIAQSLKNDDDIFFMQDLRPLISDKRYITVEGKPLLIIYRPHFWPQDRVLRLLSNFRKCAGEFGFPGLYLIAALSHNFQGNPEDWGFDAGVEFPPHKYWLTPTVPNLRFANPNFRGKVCDMRSLVSAKEYMVPSAYTTLKTAFPGWDNIARRPNNGFIFHNAEPPVYKAWLKNILRYTHEHNPPHLQYVFINAWNEWAEGAHLEPDRKYGHAFLQATAEALEEFSPVNWPLQSTDSELI